MPHMANNRPSRICMIIKKYQYYTISLRKYQKKRSKKVLNGQNGQK